MDWSQYGSPGAAVPVAGAEQAVPSAETRAGTAPRRTMMLLKSIRDEQ